MSLKSQFLQLSALSVAATTLFGSTKDKENTEVMNIPAITAPSKLPEKPQQTSAPKTPSPTISAPGKKIINNIQVVQQATTQVSTQPSVQETKENPVPEDRKMTENEVEQFMQTKEYKKWRDKLGERWLIGMSGSVSEGFCPWCYMCTKGVLTIGHGIAETNGMDFSKFPLYFEDGTKMSERQVRQYLAQVKKKEPKTSEAKKVAHSVIIDGKPAKVAGMKYRDSLSIALTEVRHVIDTVYKRSYNEKDIDFRKEPFAVQMLIVDIGYQVGPDNFVSKWKNFFSAVKSKQYSKLINQVSTKERADGRRNERRHQSKLLLAKLSDAQAKKDQVRSHNIVNELYAIGANIYNLKFRAVHNSTNPNTKLKTRNVGGFPIEVQRMFNIDKDGNPIAKKAPTVQKPKKRSTRKRRRGGGR